MPAKPDKFFLIGVGGTGMRCLEAFVHLCAMGMLDGVEVYMLALDTDLENGNFSRLQRLVAAYRGAKGREPHAAQHDTLFSAKLTFFRFCPDYSLDDRGTLEQLAGLVGSEQIDRQLYELLLAPNVQAFNLRHGYRAQTHLGALLMYHALVEETRNHPEGDISRYVQAMFAAGEAEGARAFVMGSVFGGTGASSIPIMPQAFADALNEHTEGRNLQSVPFGATLVTSYFTFAAAAHDARQEQKVVAEAANFAMNSQAALMFYDTDGTVRSTYRRLYMLGTPTADFPARQINGKILTGGAEQCNNSHFLELMCAMAARDFCYLDRKAMREGAANLPCQYFYRAVEANGRLGFRDFVSADETSRFAGRFACLTGASLIVLLNDMVAQARNEEYGDLSNEEASALGTYFQAYHFALTSAGVQPGWLRQVHASAGGNDRFMFNPALFGASTADALRGLSGKLFPPGDYETHNVVGGFWAGKGHYFNVYKDRYRQLTNAGADRANAPERLMKRVFDALWSLHRF
jgi:hypothetical protein